MSTTTSTTTEATRRTAAVTELGVGARVSVHPHTDAFVDVITGALDDVRAAGLTDGLQLQTDEVSTWVGALEAPAEQRIAAYVSELVAATSRRSGGGHVVAHVLLSRGCPGEATCDLTVGSGVGLPTAAPVELAPTGVDAVAQWSLYPLMDAATSTADGVSGEHMTHIEAAIAAAQRRGTASAAAHYATVLRGDVADVLATAVDAWAAVGAVVPHVVTHLTVSTGSPTPAGGPR